MVCKALAIAHREDNWSNYQTRDGMVVPSLARSHGCGPKGAGLVLFGLGHPVVQPFSINA